MLFRATRGTIRRRFTWFSLAGLFALAPKCVLCFGAYASIGAWLGLRFSNREFCSVTPTIGDFSTAWIAATLIIFFGAWFFRKKLREVANNVVRIFTAATAAKGRTGSLR
jgi:hypothetical protein